MRCGDVNFSSSLDGRLGRVWFGQMLKFATWNVNNRMFKPSHVEFLKSLQPDVLALQEISVGFHAALVESGVFDWGVSSLELRPAEAGGTARRLSRRTTHPASQLHVAVFRLVFLVKLSLH